MIKLDLEIKACFWVVAADVVVGVVTVTASIVCNFNYKVILHQKLHLKPLEVIKSLLHLLQKTC